MREEKQGGEKGRGGKGRGEGISPKGREGTGEEGRTGEEWGGEREGEGGEGKEKSLDRKGIGTGSGVHEGSREREGRTLSSKSRPVFSLRPVSPIEITSALKLQRRPLNITNLCHTQLCSATECLKQTHRAATPTEQL